MPSLHFGWNLLVGFSMWLASAHILVRTFAVLMPLAMLTDIVLTANHYILDAAAGLLVVTLGLGIALGARELIRWYRLRQAEPSTYTAWHDWLCWLCGLAEPQDSAEQRMSAA